MKARGFLTEESKNFARDFLGRDISDSEYQLYPHIDYRIKNPWQFSFRRLNEEEKLILKRLYKERHLVVWNLTFLPSKKFYRFLQDMLEFSYVDFLEDGIY